MTLSDRIYAACVSWARNVERINQRNVLSQGAEFVISPALIPKYNTYLDEEWFFLPLHGAGLELFVANIREPFSAATYVASLQFLRDEFPALSVYDIGTHFGYYARLSYPYAKELYLFEPQGWLKQFIDVNVVPPEVERNEQGLPSVKFVMGATEGKVDGVHYFPAAVWLESGEIGFSVPEDVPNFARVDPRVDHKVSAIGVDDLPSSRYPSVVRMDIEGGEAAILIPIVDRLSPEIVFVEHHPNETGVSEQLKLFDEMRERGYRPFYFYEPIASTRHCPFHKQIWHAVRIGYLPDYGISLEDSLFRGWVVHVIWVKNESVARSLERFRPWDGVWRLL